MTWLLNISQRTQLQGQPTPAAQKPVVKRSENDFGNQFSIPTPPIGNDEVSRSGDAADEAAQYRATQLSQTIQQEREQKAYDRRPFSGIG